jgi:hypothetical protein
LFQSEKEKEGPSTIEKLTMNTMASQGGNMIVCEIARVLLGVIALGDGSRKKRASLFA